ncbi:cytochrome P450 [Lenzites betulinus]|nr:cytochrome P450 [Lenzites betulinus]
MIPLPQLVAGSLVLYAAWRLVRMLFVKSPMDNVAGPISESWFTGNVGMYYRDRWGFHNLVRTYGRVFIVKGLFSARSIWTYDSRALHSVYVKDQDVFHQSSVTLAIFMATMGPGLLSTVDPQHRRQRKILNPVFSAKHLRDMTPVFNEIIGRLNQAISSRVNAGTMEIDMLGWMGRTALELIGQGGFGRSFDPLTRDVADDFAEAIKAYFPVVAQLDLPRQFLPQLLKIGPPSLRRFIIKLVPYAPVRRIVEISDALHKCSVELYNEKKAALQTGDEAAKRRVGESKDIMSVLMRENMLASEEDRLPDEDVIGQVSTLMLAAMDTTSNALARILSLLAEHQHVQQKLREELVVARDDGTGSLRDLDYDEVMNLPYLDAVCRESLRRYPPITVVMREASRDAVLPLSAPIRGINGEMMDSIPVTKGTEIYTDVLASNCNKDLWGNDAEEWKPERWLSKLPKPLVDAPNVGVYSHLMTFVGGSRACIGFKFSQLEMKVVLASLIPAFKFELSDKHVYWNAAGVSFPSAGKANGKPELPLKVAAL